MSTETIIVVSGDTMPEQEALAAACEEALLSDRRIVLVVDGDRGLGRAFADVMAGDALDRRLRKVRLEECRGPGEMIVAPCDIEPLPDRPAWRSPYGPAPRGRGKGYR